MRTNFLIQWSNPNTWLGILLFFVGLGLLVTIHELGHFIAAKSYKVYCSDFSIGFGPKIVKIKRKTGETKFSIGIVPLGGYVAMYGEEGDELPNGVSIPKSRSIQGISRWKRYIIFGAGIFMNFVLAYVVFFIACSCFPHYDTYGTILDYNGKAYEGNQSQLVVYDESGNEITDLKRFDVNNELGASFRNEEFYQFETRNISYKYNGKDVVLNVFVQSSSYDVLSKFTLKPYELTVNGETNYYVLGMDTTNFGINNIDYSLYLRFYKATKFNDTDFKEFKFSNNGKYVEYSDSLSDIYLPILKDDSSLEYMSFSSDYNSKISGEKLLTLRGYQNKTLYQATLKPYFENDTLTSFNFNMYQYTYWLGWSSFKEAGNLWVKSCSLISQALGKLLIGQGWDSVGGPVAIMSVTTSQLINNPFYIYLYNWAMISVNLALFNLLPFPGLDGWQILVEIIEGIVNGIKKKKYKIAVKKEIKSNENNISTQNGSEVNAVKEEQVISVGKEEHLEYVDWRIPQKVKSIVSYVGLGLLFALAIVIFIMDIIRLF